ncbi:unnamed protein product [Ectocarpus sp. 8 AP-2014]
MVNVRCSNKCGYPDCKTRASYGLESRRIAELCAKHATQGMMNVYSKKRGHNLGDSDGGDGSGDGNGGSGGGGSEEEPPGDGGREKRKLVEAGASEHHRRQEEASAAGAAARNMPP